MAPGRLRDIHEVLRLSIELPGIKLAMLECAHLYTRKPSLEPWLRDQERFDATYVDPGFWFLILARFWSNPVSDDQ